MNFLNPYELPILDYIQKHFRSPFGDTLFPAITHLADAGILWLILTFFFILYKKMRLTGLTMGLALILCVLIGNATLKPLVARIRPYELNSSVTLLIHPMPDFSFPSGHTLASFSCAYILLRTHRRILGYPALILATLIAFSRLYLYVHYPTDVLAGILLGMVLAQVTCRIVYSLQKRFFPNTNEHRIRGMNP